MSTDEEIREWIAAEKQPTRRGIVAMKWTPSGLSATWKCTLAAGGISQGAIICVAKKAPREIWHFSLLLHKTQVLRWDIEHGARRNHRNKGCPPAFPSRIRAGNQEHQWVEGMGTACAIVIQPEFHDEATHREVWDAFCVRANIRGRISHVSPSFDETPLRLFDELP